jgi:hypothetical protein
LPYTSLLRCLFFIPDVSDPTVSAPSSSLRVASRRRRRQSSRRGGGGAFNARASRVEDSARARANAPGETFSLLLHRGEATHGEARERDAAQ